VIPEASFELGRILARIDQANLDDRIERGESRVFNLKPGQHMVRWYPMVGKTRYCYTPHADTNGDFWAFNEVRRVWRPKAKLGELCESWERVKWVRCARPKTARERALKRYKAAVAKRDAKKAPK